MVMGHNVVCISRQEGAGGPEIALAAAQQLGFRLIDEDIVERAAVEAGVECEVIADLERGRTALVRLIEEFGAAGMGAAYLAPIHDTDARRQPASHELRGLIRSVIEEFAAKGKAVILAHAASLALAERGDVLRVLITACREERAQRLATTLGIEDKQAARAIKQSDAGRADYLKRFYGVGAELPTHYDLVINTDRLAAEQAARLIVAAASPANVREPAVADLGLEK
jgi:cytidylate kinase